MYDKALNLKGIASGHSRTMTYHEYLKSFYQLSEVSQEYKNNVAYRQYVEALVEYLSDFVYRTKPLTDVKTELDEATKDFEAKWSKGQAPGWLKTPQSAQSNAGALLDLRSFDAVEEIKELGLDRLKSALMALGEKISQKDGHKIIHSC